MQSINPYEPPCAPVDHAFDPHHPHGLGESIRHLAICFCFLLLLAAILGLWLSLSQTNWKTLSITPRFAVFVVPSLLNQIFLLGNKRFIRFSAWFVALNSVWLLVGGSIVFALHRSEWQDILIITFLFFLPCALCFCASIMLLRTYKKSCLPG